MNWTRRKPTEPGYYWWRRYQYKAVVLMSVWGVAGLWCRRIDTDQLCERYDVDEFGGEWFGPIVIELTNEQQVQPPVGKP